MRGKGGEAHGTCADIPTAVFRTAEKDEDAGDKVDYECAKEEEPELKDPCDNGAGCLGNFVLDGMEDQRKNYRAMVSCDKKRRGERTWWKIISAMDADVLCLLVELLLAGLELAFSTVELFKTVGLRSWNWI